MSPLNEKKKLPRFNKKKKVINTLEMMDLKY